MEQIKEIPLIASEVQTNRLERVINKLLIINVIQVIVIMILLIIVVNGGK